MGTLMKCKKCNFTFGVGYPGRGIADLAKEKNIPYNQAIDEYYKKMEKLGARVYRLEPGKCPSCGTSKKTSKLSRISISG